MNPLLTNLTALQALIAPNSRLQLISVISAFDPVNHTSREDEDFYIDWDADPDEAMEYSLRNLRRNFPDIYSDAIQYSNAGHSYAETEKLVIQKLEAIHLHNNDFDTLSQGFIPMYAVGIMLDDYESWEQHEELRALFTLFDPAHPTDIEEDYVPPAVLYETGYYLVCSLHAHRDKPALDDLYNFFCWMFSCSGNSLVDISYENHEEFQPLCWDNSGDIEAAQQIQLELDEISEHINLCLDHHFLDEALMKTLRKNTARIHKHIARKGLLPDRTPLNDYRIKLHWSN